MNVSMESDEQDVRCSWSGREDSVTPYCFGDLSEEDRYRFEAHLLDCPACWREVQRLDSVIRAIRMDRSLTRQFDPEIVSLVGSSSQVPRAFFGHKAHCLTASALYALALAVSVFMEIAYAYSEFGPFAWAMAPLVLVWGFLTTLGALAADAKMTRSGRKPGLLVAIAILVAAAVANYEAVGTQLPDYAITQASFQTWTAQAAYLKGIVYCGVFTALFLLVPFHFVVAMQCESSAGRHRVVHQTLTGGTFGIPPRGAPYLGVWLLGGLLILGAASSVVSTAHLLEALKPAAYSNLFIETIVVRWLLFLFLGIECCWWYYSALNELKRESAAGSLPLPSGNMIR